MARMRIFAGPNGSGKTTLNEQLQGKVNFGFYLNPDDLFRKIVQDGALELNCYEAEGRSLNWKAFRDDHGLLSKLKSDDAKVVCSGGQLDFSKSPSVYLVSIVIDYLRHLLMLNNTTFSFATIFNDFQRSGKAALLTIFNVEALFAPKKRL